MVHRLIREGMMQRIRRIIAMSIASGRHHALVLTSSVVAGRDQGHHSTDAGASASAADTRIQAAGLDCVRGRHRLPQRCEFAA